MEIDSQEHDTESSETLLQNSAALSPSKGEVLKILDQTIQDGGSVKYTVLWANGDTTEESVEALGKWDDLVQEYEHSQFSKSETKPSSTSPPPSRKPPQTSTKGDSDSGKRRPSVTTRPTRTKARAQVQYFEGEESDDTGDYNKPRNARKSGTRARKPASSGDDGLENDQEGDSVPTSAAATPVLSSRGYPRRAAQANLKLQQVALESSESSSDDVAPTKAKSERKQPAAPRQKKSLIATSTESTFVQAHHPFCTRCGQRGELTKRKSKKKSDDEEDDEPLGTLLLCECCSAGYHRLCLRKAYSDSLVGTGFRCEACIKSKGAECLECHEWVGRSPAGTPLDVSPATAPQAESDVLAADPSTPSSEPTSMAVMDGTLPEVDTVSVNDEQAKAMDIDAETEGDGATEKSSEPSTSSSAPQEVLFRCFRCTYSAHDRCLKPLSTMEQGIDHAQVIKQYRKDWKCHQCLEWDRELELILAFRDVPIVKANAASATDMDVDPLEAQVSTSVVESIKDGSTFPQAPNTRRELLVKWKNMSYRKVTWVPSYWVSQVVSPVKVKSFWKRTSGPADVSDVVSSDWTQVDAVLDVIFEEDFDGNEDDMDAMDHIQSVFVKWKSLDYEHATWDEPDEPDSEHYGAFKQAFKDWVTAQKIVIPSRAKKGRSGPQPKLHSRAPFTELKEQPSYVSGGTLKDYQMDGLNWLRYNHWKNVNSILADEMGLGKTIQMVAFVTTLYHQLQAFPCLIVVPNSTLTNWVREFAKWAPDLRVVPYYGGQSSRSVVRDYELFHRGTHDLKCHVVVTTYEMIVNPVDSALFRKNSWECLVVDEGQRLKNENSMLFVKLNELVVENRVLLTGTPLQNNIRELFSLMNFLDPVQFSDVTELEKKYENLDKAAVEELHGLLKPFFLRRTKDEVLKDLPPKSEVIVPVGMSALQKEIYKGVLARNHKLLQSITNRGGTASNRKASLHNILMELRKCLNHPYLIEGVEPRYLNTMELVHKSLIEAGGKLELLHAMLPKLKQNGHRVLIFSTMTRLLDILEDYLNGERYNFVRLDGSTSSSDRQARIDKFNAPDSDVFVFLLSTRAGGVGVNLATADTIIIYDVDFNPKADMQALSRAHRIGQKNKVLVLKFMTRNSAEERIVQIGKKKMILDHLIVERMEDENLDPVDVESILKFGAKALFEEDTTTNEDLKYDDAALEALLDRSKIEHTWDENDNGETKVSGFGFAKVWTETKGVVDEDMSVDPPVETEQEGFWSTLLRDRLAMSYAQEEELLGRGARRKTVLSYAENGNNNENPSSKKRKAGKELPSKEEEDYIDQDIAASDAESVDSDVELDPNAVLAELEGGKRPKKNKGLGSGDPNMSPSRPGDIEGMDPSDNNTGLLDGSPTGMHLGGKMKKARMQPSSPYQMSAGVTPGRGLINADSMNRKVSRKSQPCLVCHRSHRDRCPESQDIPLVLERRQQIATSNYPDSYKTLALATLDRFLLDKQITPVELPKGRAAKSLSAAAARLSGSAYQDNLRSMSIGKSFVPTITPGACIVCNQVPYHLPFKCTETRNVQFMQERCRAITLDPTISDAKKQEYVSTIKALITREAPRANAPPSGANSSSRRQGSWAGPGSAGLSNSSSRGAPTSAAASVIMAAAAASGGKSGPSSKHSGAGYRTSQPHLHHSQHHQAYSSQVSPQFMSSRPGMPDVPSSMASQRSEGTPRPRDYVAPAYVSLGGSQPYPASGHMTSGARESSNYQPRKPAYRGEDGTIVIPPGRSTIIGTSGRTHQEYGADGQGVLGYGRSGPHDADRVRSTFGRADNGKRVEHERAYHTESRTENIARHPTEYSQNKSFVAPSRNHTHPTGSHAQTQQQHSLPTGSNQEQLQQHQFRPPLQTLPTHTSQQQGSRQQPQAQGQYQPQIHEQPQQYAHLRGPGDAQEPIDLVMASPPTEHRSPTDHRSQVGQDTAVAESGPTNLSKKDDIEPTEQTEQRVGSEAAHDPLSMAPELLAAELRINEPRPLVDV